MANQAEAVKTAAEIEQEQQNQMKLKIDDMRAEGMTQYEIDAELERQKNESAQKPQEKKNEQAQTTPEEDKAKKQKEDEQKAADLKAAEEKKKADVISDMIFAREREEKRKAQEAAVIKAREELRAKMTPEQLAAENEALEAEREKNRQKDTELFSVKQDAAFEKAQKSIPPEEWELIAPKIKEFIDSKDYDEAIKNPDLDPVKFTGEIVQKAKERAIDALIELRIKQKQSNSSAEEKIRDLKDFGGPKSPPNTETQKSELELLTAKAMTRGLTSSETERMLKLQDEEDSKRK